MIATPTKSYGAVPVNKAARYLHLANVQYPPTETVHEFILRDNIAPNFTVSNQRLAPVAYSCPAHRVKAGSRCFGVRIDCRPLNPQHAAIEDGAPAKVRGVTPVSQPHSE